MPHAPRSRWVAQHDSPHSTRSVFHGDPIAEPADIVFPIASVGFRGSRISVVRITPIKSPTGLIDDSRGKFRRTNPPGTAVQGKNREQH